MLREMDEWTHRQIDNVSNLIKPHMRSLQPTKWQGTLVYIHCILLAYASEQICLPHSTYMSLNTNAVVMCRPHITAHLSLKQKMPIRCRFLILLVESWSKVVISGTVHWFDLKTSFHPLL